MTPAEGTIVRTWSARAGSAGAGHYGRYFADTLLPQLRELPGFAGGYLLRRDLDEDGVVELTTHTFWDSAEAIRAFAGDDITRSIVEPEAQAMLRDFDRAAAHRIVVVGARRQLCGRPGGSDSGVRRQASGVLRRRPRPRGR